MKCHRCKKPLSNHFVRAMGQVWHRECLRCEGCDKVIYGQYIKKQGKPWHQQCFQEKFIPRCDVCKKYLTGQYLQDYWGNNFCLSHRKYAKCTSCGRVVCGPITGGGMQFPDGLMICNLCANDGVATNSRAQRLALEMREALKKLGLNLYNAETPVRLADRDELHSNSRHDHHDEHPLLGLAIWSTSFAGKRIVSRDFREILVQKNLPEEHFRTVVIHELGHAWFFYNNPKGKRLPLKVEEGMCVLLEYLWLRRQKTEEAKYRMKVILETKDPIYGDGFREAKKSLKYLSLPSLVRYVLDKGKFPSALSAFFYN
ncbi:protein DA1 [Sansalvadorimonas sp. 2012CJ34-2]|uniref:Protein DA1 n=1 Tax=Parendozoicomonas callyspongiae TaxID=2942213 RepID=A0ABT0PCZ4_9GAMM|nr:protein DA1 [Sansalvadorimonas sp. 2012CJ34-2]MCL6269200.1 protein DA1 [Sansalvadorimonas sp. 2012CJ34-2]